MKKLYRVLMLILCAILVTGLMPTAFATGAIAVKSNQQIYIDGQLAEITAYNVGGNNYVRLRDLAETMDFDIYYDGADGSVHISTSQPYSGGSAELAETPQSIEVAATQLTLYVNDNLHTITAYNILGNNYSKLREIGAAVDFGVDWDAKTRRVLIDTSKSYTPEVIKTPQVTPDTPAASETPQPDDAIPAGTAVDYSLDANPEIFDNYYTREKYNTDRQRVLDTGTLVTNWGTRAVPQSDAAIRAADKFFSEIAQMSEYDKIISINSFLCDHLTYNAGTGFSGDDFWTGTAYGVCEEYSLIFEYMCFRAGISCISISGEADGNSHSWNEVYHDGKWQHYDGNLSDIRKAAALGDLSKKGHDYVDNAAKSTLYRKEVHVPGSTK